MNKIFRIKPIFRLCQQLLNISFFTGYIAISLLSSSSHAQPIAQIPQPPYYPNPIPPNSIGTVGAPFAILNNWRFSPEAMQLEFGLSANIKPQYFYLAQPPRIVVDLPNTRLGYVPTQQNYSGVIQKVRVSQFNAEITRIVLDLAPGNFLDPNQLNLQPVSQNNLTRWVLRPLNPGSRNPVQPAIYPQPSNLPVNPNYPQQPSNLPQIPDNYSQPPISPIDQTTNPNQPLPFFTLPPPSTNLPAIPTNQQQPLVVVPPLQPNNQSQLPSSVLPPHTFSNQPPNLNNPATIASPNFPMPTIPQYPSNEMETMVIEFGQPIPKMRN
jgi:hypothetical protein